MDAIVCSEFGEPASVLRCEELPRPTPGPGELLVEMLASPINPSDLLSIRGLYGANQPPLPFIPGYEGVGIVRASGGGLLGRFLIGRRVAILHRRGGLWRGWSVVPANRVFPISNALETQQAATMFVNPTTALLLTRKFPGKWIIQSAARSQVGQMMIKLGLRQGFETINLVRKESDLEPLRELGAKYVFCSPTPEENPVICGYKGFVEYVREVTKGLMGDVALDPVGGDVTRALVQSLRPEGKLVCFGSLSPQPWSVTPRDLINHGIQVVPFWLGRELEQLSLWRKFMLFRRVQRQIIAGTLRSTIQGLIHPKKIQQGVTRAETNSSSGKILLNFEGTLN